MFCLYQKRMFIVILLFTVEEMNKWQYYAVTTLITHLNFRTQSTTKSLKITKLYPTKLKNLYSLQVSGRWNCLGLYSKYYLCWKQWPTYSLCYCPKLGLLIVTYNYHHSHHIIIYLKFNFQYQCYTLGIPATRLTATSWQPNTFTYRIICSYSYSLN